MGSNTSFDGSIFQIFLLQRFDVRLPLKTSLDIRLSFLSIVHIGNISFVAGNNQPYVFVWNHYKNGFEAYGVK